MAEVNESDALTIARWCWADKPWQHFSDTACSAWTSTKSLDWMAVDSWKEIHAAERGLAEEYGRALYHELSGEDWDPGALLEFFADQYTKTATAPLDARVRAMAAVIREAQK